MAQTWLLLSEVEGLYGGGAVESVVASVRLRLGLLALALSHKSSTHSFPLPLLAATIEKAKEFHNSARGISKAASKVVRFRCPEDTELCTEAESLMADLADTAKKGRRLVLSDSLRAQLHQLVRSRPLTWPSQLDLPRVSMLTGRLSSARSPTRSWVNKGG